MTRPVLALGSPPVRKGATAPATSEFQARRAAHDFVAGKRALGDRLTAAPRSGLRVPASRGEPLALAVRSAFEGAFTADLAAIRIHRDPAAFAAADELGANAFAAGHDIYFARAMYSPGSETGRERLAHEIAHVLQQTGRRSSDGRLAATAGHGGPGPVQREEGDEASTDEPGPTKTELAAREAAAKRAEARKALRAKGQEKGRAAALTLWEKITFNGLANAHAPAGSPDFDTFADGLAAALHLATPAARDATTWPVLTADQRTAFFTALRTLRGTHASLFASQGAGRGLLYDCYKKMGAFEDAVILLKEDPKLLTVAMHFGVVDALDTEEGAKLVKAQLDADPVAKAVIPAFVARAAKMLVSPNLVPGELKVSAAGMTVELTKLVLDYFASAKSPDVVGDNELWLVLFARLFDLHHDHERVYEDARKLLAGERGWIPALKRRGIAEGVRDWAQGLDEFTPEVDGHFETLLVKEAGPKVLSLALGALDFWTQFAEPDGAALDPDLFRKNADFAALGKDLLAQAGKFLALHKTGGKDVLPSAWQYDAALGKWRESLLAGLVSRLDKPLQKRLFGKEQLPLADDTARSYGQAIRYVDVLVGGLDKYKVEDDLKEERHFHLDDYRGAHRARQALTLQHVADVFAWKEISALGRDVSLGLDRQENHVHLRGDWEMSAESNLSDMKREVPDPVEDKPYTGGAVADFFDMLITQERARKLRDLLDASPAVAAAGEDRVSLRHQVNRLLADYRMPQRWVVADFVFSLKPAQLTQEKATELGLPGTVYAHDVPAAIRKDLKSDAWESPGVLPGDLVKRHEKTKAQLIAPMLERGDGGLIPRYNTEAVLAWTFPDPVALVPLLRKEPALNQLIIDYEDEMVGKDKPAQLAWVAGLPDSLWQTGLVAAMEADPATRKAVFGTETDGDTGLLGTTVSAGLEGARFEYREQLRRAAVVERQVLVQTARQRLAGSDDLATRVLAPDDITHDLQGFSLDLFPGAQEKLDPSLVKVAQIQVNVAMLQLAAPLLPAIRHVDNDAVTIGLLELVAQAERMLEDLPADLAAAKANTLAEFLAPDEKTAEILEQKQSLRQLREALRSALWRRVFSRGFKGGPAAGDDKPFLQGIDRGGRLEPGTPFYRDGEHFEVKSVLRPFTYFPSFGPERGTGGRIHAARAEGQLFEGVLSDSSPESRGGRSLIKDDVELFVLVVGDPEQSGQTLRIVKSSERVFLDWISHGVMMNSMLVQLEHMGANLQVFADLIMEVMVIMFGGPVGAYAKSMLDMAQLAADEDFAQLLEAFEKDPLKLVRDLAEKLKGDVLEPENILKFLLFPSASPLEDALARMGKSKKKKKASGKGKGKGLGHVLSVLFTLGEKFAIALAGLHKRVEGPLGGIRAKIATEPRLAAALGFVSTYGPVLVEALAYLYELAQEGEEAIGQRIAEFKGGEGGATSAVADFADGLVEGNATLSEQIEAVGELFARMRLPEEIIPLEALLAAVANAVLRLSARKAKGKILAAVASASGGVDAAAAALAKEIRGTDRDPNKYWRDSIIPLVEGRFTKARDEMATGVFEVLQACVNGAGDVLGRKDLKDMKFTYQGAKDPIRIDAYAGDFASGAPDASPFPDQSAPPREGMPIAAFGEGRPLPDDVAGDVEARFGHDFRHVRVHEGEEGRRATGSAGALALTSGSHVFLRDDHSLASAAGRRVLDHELAHVIQHAGPRPLGRKHADAPRPGKPGRGLRIDPSRETQAERVASTVRSRTSPGPISVGGAIGDEGYAPALSNKAIRGLIGLFADFRETGKYQRGIDKRAKVKKAAASVPGGKEAELLWAEIEVALSVESNYAAPFKKVSAQIKGWLAQPEVNKQVRAAIPYIAEDVQVPVNKADANAPAKDAKDAKAKTTELHAGNFAKLLAGYVFTKTGVAMRIGVKGNRLEEPGPFLKNGGLEVHYLNLGRIPLSHSLWQAVGGIEARSATDKRELQVRMASLDPGPDVWLANKFVLRTPFVDRMTDHTGAKALPPTAPPKKKDYRKTTGGDGRALQVGKHGDLKKLDNRKARESHHTTQVLLIDYFRNSKVLHAFKEGLDYPGVQWDGKQPTRFEGANRPAIEFETLDRGERGDPMPAILIAAETHRRGKVHLDGSNEWDPVSETDDTNSSIRQSFLVDMTFQKQLPKALRRTTTAAKLRAEVNKGKGAAELAIHDAILGTYRWMYEQTMKPALDAALEREEVAFYRGWAARYPSAVADAKAVTLKGDWDLKADDLKPAAEAAEKNNRKVMGEHGWK